MISSDCIILCKNNLRIFYYNITIIICMQSMKFVIYQVLQFYQDLLHRRSHSRWYHRSFHHHTFSLPTKIECCDQQISFELKVKVKIERAKAYNLSMRIFAPDRTIAYNLPKSKLQRKYQSHKLIIKIK